MPKLFTFKKGRKPGIGRISLLIGLYLFLLPGLSNTMGMLKQLSPLSQMQSLNQQLMALADQLKALQEQKQQLLNQLQDHVKNKPEEPTRSAFPEGEAGQEAYNQGMAQYNQGMAQWNSQKSQLESQLSKVKIFYSTGGGTGRIRVSMSIIAQQVKVQIRLNFCLYPFFHAKYQ